MFLILFINNLKIVTQALVFKKTKRRENNALKKYKEDRLFTTINNLTLLEWVKIPKIKFNAYVSDLVDKKETSYQSESISKTEFEEVNTNFTIKPNINVLNKLSFDGDLKNIPNQH